MNTRNKRWASLGIVAFFCLLCAGTSRPKGSRGRGKTSVKPAPVTSAPTRVAHSTLITERIDPLDPKLEGDGGHFDAYVLTLAGKQKYRVRVAPPKSDAGVGPDAGMPELWFSVRVSRGTRYSESFALAVQERVEGDKTVATFTPTLPGDHTLVVTAYFGRDESQTPGFSTYELEVTPVP